MALVLLRFAFGLTGIAEGVLWATRGASFASHFLGASLASAGLFVLLGLFTPFSSTTAVLCMAFHVLAFSYGPHAYLLQGPELIAILIALGIAIALLGPGAFSLDFRLFGRREIIIPRRTRE